MTIQNCTEERQQPEINFTDFKSVVHEQMRQMSARELFRTDTSKDDLWETYLSSFPPGTNPIFRERTEHDCQCCKQFIRACGNMVAIVAGELVSIWDIEIGGYYQVVADALSKLVKSNAVRDAFFHTEQNVGTDFNRALLDSGEVITFSHFHFKLPEKFVKRGEVLASDLSKLRSTKDVFYRGLSEITEESAETVLELIEQNSIYRGAEHKGVVDLFVQHKKAFDKAKNKDNYCWVNSLELGLAARIRNTVIGTLLVDLSEGKELDVAVKAFESKVAPENYKRPSALITKSMITNAEKKVAELGILDALSRRYAVAEDITINNVLFANREAKKAMNVFGELAEAVPENVSSLSKVEEVGISDFIDNILLKADSIELLFENKHCNNLVSLIAPENLDAKNIFKWNNNFSWSYNGEVTDSIKERVKNAGGNVAGYLRCSLAWFNHDDLDIHVVDPSGAHICYSDMSPHGSNGRLDVDMNAGGRRSRNAVENIVWAKKADLQEGKYQVYINNYAKRESIDVGFDAEIEINGELLSFHYEKALRDKEDVLVARFAYFHGEGIKLLESLPLGSSSKEVWGINTQKFHKVSMVMNSPNHWDGNETGNKHWFFVLDGCLNDKKARGFYNEFLSNELTEHRKVFEVLGSKMKTEESDNQLSGLGFSSTQRNHVFCKVTGAFSRTIKINF